MSDQWYLARNNQKHGPYSSAQLQEFARAGRIVPTDMLLKDGTGKWVPASQVKGLFPQTSAKPVQQAAPKKPQPVDPTAKATPTQPAAEPFQALGDGAAPKAQAASLPPFVSKARDFFRTKWTTKKIAIVGGAAGGALLLLIVVLIAAMSGGGRPGSSGDGPKGGGTKANVALTEDFFPMTPGKERTCIVRVYTQYGSNRRKPQPFATLGFSRSSVARRLWRCANK